MKLKAAPPNPARKTAWLLAAALAAALAAYWPVLGARLVWDDAIVHTRQMPYVTGFAEALFPSSGIPGLSSLYYRPLVFLSYLADHRLAALLGSPGADPAAWLHATNLALHLAATALVFLLARRLLPSGGDFAPLGAALLFGLHPIHVEAVAMVAGRADLLAAVFVLSAALLTLRHAHSPSPGVAVPAGFCIFLALLAKENAAAFVALPALCFWGEFSKEAPSDRRGRLLLVAAFGLAAAGYAGLRVAAGVRLAPPGAALSPTALADLLSALGYGLGKSLWPWPHNHHASALPPWPLAALFIISALGGAAFLWRKRPASRAPLAFCGLWFLAALAPALAAVPQHLLPTLMAERYLYLPSVAVALLAGFLLHPLFAVRPRATRLAAALLLAALGAASFVQARVWRTEISFWESTAKVADNAQNPDVLVNLGESYRMAGRWDEAIATLERAAPLPAVAQTRATIGLNLAAVRAARAQRALETGDASGAARDADAALADLQGVGEAALYDPLFYNFRGAALLLKGRALERLSGLRDPALFQAACQDLERAARLDPRNPNVARNLAECRRWLAPR